MSLLRNKLLAADTGVVLSVAEQCQIFIKYLRSAVAFTGRYCLEIVTHWNAYPPPKRQPECYSEKQSVAFFYGRRA